MPARYVRVGNDRPRATAAVEARRPRVREHERRLAVQAGIVAVARAARCTPRAIRGQNGDRARASSHDHLSAAYLLAETVLRGGAFA